MTSLGLVAYDSSDEDSENGDVDEQNHLTSPESSNQNKLSQSKITETSDTASGSGSAGGGHSGTLDTDTAPIRDRCEEVNVNDSSSAVINEIGSTSSSLAHVTSVLSSRRGCDSGSTQASVSNSQQSNNRIDDISDEEDIVSSTTGPVGQFPSALSGHSDEEDVGPGPAKFSILAGLPAPRNQQTEDVDISFFTSTTRPRTVVNRIRETTESSASLLSLVSELPAPKPSSAVTLSGYEEEDEVEEEYKKKPVKAEIPLPVPKKRQPVKITVPSLAELDSDDEDDGPKKKKPRPAEGGLSGLLSMLPTPKQIVVKEKGRALIPHTLTKKPAPKPSVAKPGPMVTPSTSGRVRKLPGIADHADSDSEEDSDSVNFFSFGGDEPSSTASTSTDFSEVVIRTNPKIKPRGSLKPGPSSGAKPDSTSPSSTAMFLSHMDTKEKTVSSSMDVTARDHLTGLRGPYSSGSGQSSDFSQIATGSYYNEGYGQDSEAAAGFSGDVAEQYDNSGLYQPSVEQMEQMTSDEQFQRMVGKKFRGEAMHIVDVNADDQMSKEDLTKHLTEEVAGFSYSKKKNKDMPSSVQKRKHQITYLAFQAKERELELKNQWAQNRQTKRQTQSKYGF